MVQNIVKEKHKRL